MQRQKYLTTEPLTKRYQNQFSLANEAISLLQGIVRKDRIDEESAESSHLVSTVLYAMAEGKNSVDEIAPPRPPKVVIMEEEEEEEATVTEE